MLFAWMRNEKLKEPHNPFVDLLSRLNFMLKYCVLIGGLAFVLIVGCKKDAGGTSPEAAFQRLQNAAANKDYDLIVGCLDEKSRQGYALRFIFEALV